jgi:lysine decarboxylase
VTVPTDQTSTPYLDALRIHGRRRPVRFNVPGHKGGAGADLRLTAALGDTCFDLDVPPHLAGIDVGPGNPLSRARELAALTWGAQTTWFLTNGASQGNLVAMLTAASLGSEVAVQRNAHSSVIDGIVLAGLVPRFLAPEIDDELGVAHTVTPETLAAALSRHPDVAAVHVTSPTYFGAVGNVPGLVAVCHARGIPLVVDEAWGGHFGLHADLPPSALACGADLVVSSTHKMVGSLTQSAMLHLGRGDSAGTLEPLIERALKLVESTSVSSLLLASLDGARHQAATAGSRNLDALLPQIRDLVKRIDDLPHLRVANSAIRSHEGVTAHDPLRVVVDVGGTGRSGYDIGDQLRDDFGIEVEVKNGRAVVLVVGMAERDLAGTSDAIIDALATITAAAPGTVLDRLPVAPPWTELVMVPRDAFFAPHETLPYRAAVGRISGETLAAYPPGIPNVVPGETVSPALVAFLEETLAQGGFVRGSTPAGAASISVVQQEAAPGRAPGARVAAARPVPSASRTSDTSLPSATSMMPISDPSGASRNSRNANISELRAGLSAGPH